MSSHAVGVGASLRSITSGLSEVSISSSGPDHAPFHPTMSGVTEDGSDGSTGWAGQQRRQRKQKMAPYPRSSIVCTIGPKTPLEECLEGGMRICRINCSHGSHDFFRSVAERLRSYCRSRPEGRKPRAGAEHCGIVVDCALAIDTKGPEIRTGKLEAVGGELAVSEGMEVVLAHDPALEGGAGAGETPPRVYVDYANITTVLAKGSVVYIDDGLLTFKVVKVEGAELHMQAMNAGTMGEKKGVNLPGAKVDLPAVSEKDKADLTLAAELGAEFVFASFIRKPEDVEAVRAVLTEAGSPGTMIISKIENQEGIDKFDRILEATDGVMVARGDMGIEIPPWKVVTAQKRMIAACMQAGKPVICATQMLESMVHNPRPTRAEVSDVANAVLDGADCVMLSGETAKGRYPLEAISVMKSTCFETDHMIDYWATFRGQVAAPRRFGTAESVAASAVGCAMDLGASAIVVVTHRGQTAAMVSKYRPAMPVIAATADPFISRQLFVHRGITPLLLDELLDDAIEEAERHGQLAPTVVVAAVKFAINAGLVMVGDKVVAVGAAPTVGGVMRSFTVTDHHHH